MALGWYDPGCPTDGQPDHPDVPPSWRSEFHKELVELCDDNCAADMSTEDFATVQAKAKALKQKVEEWDAAHGNSSEPR